MKRSLSWLVPGVVVGALLPLVVLLARLAAGRLGADPIAAALNQLGLLALVLLVASLACTPARILTASAWPMRLRRPLGLLAFAYAALHVLVYLVIDQGLAIRAIVADLVERPFILVGALAFTALVPLALTSTARSRKRLGNKAWTRLHRLAYLAAILGVTHFVLRVKKDTTEPIVYGIILAALLSIRIADRLSRPKEG